MKRFSTNYISLAPWCRTLFGSRRTRIHPIKFLADAIQASSSSQAELELLDTTTDDGKEFQIEVTAFWDDKPNQEIRVIAEVVTVPLKPLLGFIPIYFGGPSDGFIMRPDGTCIDE